MAIDEEVKLLPVMVNASPDWQFFSDKISKKIQTGPDDDTDTILRMFLGFYLSKSNNRVFDVADDRGSCIQVNRFH